METLVAELPDGLLASETESHPGEEEGEVRIALVGRPNVGKSSLANRLFGEQTYRFRTSFLEATRNVSRSFRSTAWIVSRMAPHNGMPQNWR